MPSKPTGAELESDTQACAAQIRAAVAKDHEALLRSVAVLVAKCDQRRRWPEVMEVASEILHEAVQEALRQADRFDPSRSATAWIRGIASRRLLARRREEARGRRCVSATALGDTAWAAVLDRLMTTAEDVPTAQRIDLEQALARLSSEERLALQLRYFQHLDGEGLADALGVASAGAARVRVYRALQALRAQFQSGEEEMLP